MYRILSKPGEKWREKRKKKTHTVTEGKYSLECTNLNETHNCSTLPNVNPMHQILSKCGEK